MTTDRPSVSLLLVGGPLDGKAVRVDPERVQLRLEGGYSLVENPPPSTVSMPQVLFMHDSVSREASSEACYIAKTKFLAAEIIK